MPSITSSKLDATNFPNKFISPFGDDPVVPIYSSIPFSTGQNNCLPCAICGSSFDRQIILKAEAERFNTIQTSNKEDILVGFN